MGVDQRGRTRRRRAICKTPTATPAEALKVAKDFKAELLYSVPKDKQGSWVNMCVDPKGRLIVSDQYGPLYRITPPPVGGKAEDDEGREARPAARRGARPALGVRQPLRHGQRRREHRRRATSAACTASARKDGGDTFEKPEFLRDDRRRRRARPPRHPARPGRQVALRRLRQRDAR